MKPEASVASELLTNPTSHDLLPYLQTSMQACHLETAPNTSRVSPMPYASSAMRLPASALSGPAELRKCETPVDDHLVRTNPRSPERIGLGTYCVCFVKMAETASNAEECIKFDKGVTSSNGGGIISPLRIMPQSAANASSWGWRPRRNDSLTVHGQNWLDSPCLLARKTSG